jgi:hypothetical protein
VGGVSGHGEGGRASPWILHPHQPSIDPWRCVPILIDAHNAASGGPASRTGRRRAERSNCASCPLAATATTMAAVTAICVAAVGESVLPPKSLTPEGAMDEPGTGGAAAGNVGGGLRCSGPGSERRRGTWRAREISPAQIKNLLG